MLLSKQFKLCCNISRLSSALYQQAKPKKLTQNEVYNEEYKIKFRKLQINDKDFSNMMLLVKSKKKLSKEEQIIVEGRQLIVEAVQSHFKLNSLLFSHLDKISEVLAIMGQSTGHVDFIKVPQQDLRQWSVLTTCPGVIGIFNKPPSPKMKSNALPISVICDNIREPNNLGAVIRLTNALPATKVILPKGNADPWDCKAIRGSSGSIFHMPTDYGLTWEQVDNDCSSSIDNQIVLIADNDVSKYTPSTVINYDAIPDELIAGKQIYLLVGGETHGISREAKLFATKRQWKVINIPLDASVNSLNTSNALAIILFELRRKLRIE